MAERRVPLDAINDWRRLAFCLAGAVALHAAGVLARLSDPRRAVEPPPLAPLIVPVALATVEAPEPQPPAPPPPAPVVRPEPASPDPVATTPKPVRREPPPAAPVRPLPKPRPSADADRDPAKPSEDSTSSEASKSGESAAAFGGEHGAFRALVCFLPRSTRSARAVEACKPVASFRTDAINVSPRRFKLGFPGVEKRVEWFGIDYRGRFKVRAGGYYTFRLVSDDGALLFIDGVEVLNNDGQHSPTEAKIAMPLSAGEHDLRLLYYQGWGLHLALQLFVKGYKTEERPLGPEF